MRAGNGVVIEDLTPWTTGGEGAVEAVFSTGDEVEVGGEWGGGSGLCGGGDGCVW